jgi:hypothetical protein
VQLAHNHRKGTNTQAEVLLQLGREDRLDMEGLRRLVGSISRYLDGAGALPPTAAAGQDQALEVESSRTLGAVWLLEGLWQQLGVADARHSKDHRPDLPQVVIGLAVTREEIPVRCWCWPGQHQRHDRHQAGQG